MHGTTHQGLVQFLQNGQFYIFPEMLTLSIISIGGGGGGFNNDTVSSGIKQAGDGSFSQFISVVAKGGSGGTETNDKN